MERQAQKARTQVRNRYETEIGHFQPPPGGAEFVDPKATAAFLGLQLRLLVPLVWHREPV